MATWQVQEAKAKFSEFLEAAKQEGPQIVTKRGVEQAVLVPIDEWRRVAKPRYKNIKEWLLTQEPHTDIALPSRSKLRWRKPVKLD